MANIKKMI